MIKGKWAATMKNGTLQQFKVSLEKGSTHVVQSLLDIYGTTEGDVINSIVKSWIGQNIDMLEKYGIQVKVLNGTEVMNRFEGRRRNG